MPLFGIFLAFLYYLYTVFSVPPFIEQEVVVQAYWWNQPGHTFLYKLFEPGMNDGGPGRFRYFDYLFSWAYWKLYDFGLLPRDLYDYSAIAINFALALLIYFLARRAKAPRLFQFLLPAFFLLTTPTYHTAVWHYRKAKLIVSVIFLVFTYLLQEKPSRRILASLSLLTVIGILTDPYFILIAPLLVLSKWEKTKNYLSKVKGVGLGYFISGLVIFILNGIIGPTFNPRSTLIPSGIIDPSGTLLTPINALQFYDILPDLFAPFGFSNWVATLWIILAAGFYLFSVYYFKIRLGMAVIAMLPVLAFMVRPGSHQASFAGYYGHSLFVLFLLSLIDLLRVIKKQKWAQAALVVLLLGTMGLHQLQKERAYLVWRLGHLSKQVTAQKFWKDYQEIKNINAFLKANPNNDKTYTVQLDTSHLPQIKMEAVYEKHDTGTERNRTTLAYLFIPAIFSPEIASGKLHLEKF